MLKTIAVVLLGLVLLLLGYAATRPDQFRVERSVRVAAPPEKLFPLVNDLHQFNRWNPYLRKDPGMAQNYAGPVAGPGARYAWVSKEVGAGSMQITEVSAPNRVAMALDFVKPFEAHNQAEFSLQPDGAGATRVTWAMQGPAPYMTKLMGVFFNMDRMIGTDFENGLDQLRALAEASS